MVGTPELRDWPTISVARSAVSASVADLRERIVQGGGAGIYRAETGPGGFVAARLIDHPGPTSAGAAAFLQSYLGRGGFAWEPEAIFLVNEPCYLVVATGVVLLADGTIVAETLFPTGGSTIASRIGGGLTEATLAQSLRDAPELDADVWAPLFSFGSPVFGHAVAESMVHDSALYRAGVLPFVSYAATAWPRGAQHMVLDRAHARVRQFDCPVIKVPRAMFTAKFYRHLPLGSEFERFVAATRASVLARSDLGEIPYAKIYVPRLGPYARRLTNEVALIEHLAARGFRILDGQALPFEEQVRAFSQARLIVGPYGSGLLNAAFAAPDATLCELRALNNPDHSPNWDDFYFALAAGMRFSYGVHVTENPAGADAWTCDIADVLTFIDTASAQDGVRPPPPRSARPAAGFWAIPDHAGEDHFAVIARLHAHLHPHAYLEICNTVNALALADCATIGIGPTLDGGSPVGRKPSCMLFQTTSDAFFSAYDPKLLFGRAVDMAFINGPRLFEFVLRDFFNIERGMARNSIILLHDCIPIDAHVGRRAFGNATLAGQSRHPDWWAGDVWKAVAALKQFRPDLHVHTFNAFPTGLAVITNLDPGSEVLRDRYFDIIAAFRDVELGEYGVARYLDEIDVRDTDALATPDSLTTLFWL